MFDYLAFVYGGISQPSGNPSADGQYLAQKCLDELKDIADKKRFPPRLLILLASPAYLVEQDAGQLLKGIHETFDRAGEDVQLIGSSVGGVFFDRQFHPQGALLVCLASKLIEARIAYGEDARQNPEAAVSELLRELELDTPGQVDPNPLANKIILTFLPGCSQAVSGTGFYPAPELHRLLYEGVQTRITLIGGVSSANDPSRVTSSFQFASRRVLRDSVVAASIITGVPIGVSLNDGLLPTGNILRVTKLAADSGTVLEFNGERAGEQLAQGGNLMLAKFSADDERTVDIPLLLADGSVQLLRQPETGNYFEVCKRQPASEIFKITHDGIEQAKRRVFVKRPVASLLFPCKAYTPRQEQSILNAEAALSQIEKYLENGPCVGGFFDGEIGVDETGRSRLINGGVGYVIFGDEIRERTALYKGVSSLAEHEPKVLAGSELTFASIFEAIDSALDIVEETGFPGSMISLVQSNVDRASNEAKESLVAYKARGPRFQKIINHTQRPCEGDDILAIVYREQKARFIPDSSSSDSCCDKQAIELSGIISQYVLPLKRLDNTVFATLQVDVGDLRHLSEADFRKTEKARVLDCFAEVIGASINRMVNAVMNDVMQRLDKALKQSLSENSLHDGVHKFFKEAGEAFGVEMGHLWLVKLEDNPEDTAEPTLILETGFGAYDEAEQESWRKIQTNNHSPICYAFRSTAPQIINNVGEDPPWQAMLTCIPRDSKLLRTLTPVRSYGAVAFKDERGESLGAVSFCSTKPWFFFGFHRSVMEVLAERLGFIVDHLKAKVRLKFLSDVSPRLAERNLDKAEEILQDVTEDFRLALNAEVASLYLWDQDRGKYILRAESGWTDKRWVHAARYSEDAGWIGVQVIKEQPLHVTDLHAHYMESSYKHKEQGGRYARFMFGQPLSETFTIEVIGLPLRIGSEERNIGVLTLYRRIQKGQPSSFVTTDIELLQTGAYNAAGLVNAVLRHRDDMWRKEEEERQQRIYKAITSGDGHDSFETKVCRQVLLSYHAAEVAFYRMDDPAAAQGLSWVTGCRRHRSGSQETERLDDASAEHRELIAATFHIKLNKIISQVAVSRRELNDGQDSDPEALKTQGLVKQVCVPLIGERRYLAALVIRWRLSPETAFLRRVQHSSYQLKKLGRIIGSTYLRKRITRERERSDKERQQGDLALRAANTYAVQRGHILRNTLNRIYGRIDAVDDNSTEFSELKALVKDAKRILNQWMDLAPRVLYPSYERRWVSSLVDEALQEENGLLNKRLYRLRINHAEFVPEDYLVRVDPAHTKDVLFNLINNSIEAIIRYKDYGKRKLSELGVSYDDLVPDGYILRMDPSDARHLFNLFNDPLDTTAVKKRIEKMLVAPMIDIRVTSADKRAVQLVISDNGIGMTEKEKRAAERGFVQGKEHKGVGVLFSRVLLAAQGGNLDIKTEKFKGTRAILTLPSGEMEKTDETAKFDGVDNSDRG